MSEFDPAKLFTAAVIDQARKHRKRPPYEAMRIEEHRKTRRQGEAKRLDKRTPRLAPSDVPALDRAVYTGTFESS